MSSNIPRARSILGLILASCDIDKETRKAVQLALSLMTRASPVRRSPIKQRRPITEAQKREVRSLKHSDLSQHQIASKTGLANSGRVSEIMTGKRK